MPKPTHAKLDGSVHVVVSITDAGPNSAHTHRVKFGCGLGFDVRGEHQFAHDHWQTGGPSTCPTCVMVEAGGPPVMVPFPDPTRIRKEDTPTGLPCPTCGTQIRIRADGTAACQGQGHEFDIPTVLSNGMRLLNNLARGKV